MGTACITLPIKFIKDLPESAKDLYMLKVADSLPGGETIWGYDADSISFIPGRIILLRHRSYFGCAEKGHRLKTMFYMNRPADQIYNMSEYWLPCFCRRRWKHIIPMIRRFPSTAIFT